MPGRAFITGLSGTELTASECAFLREAEPWGLILFKRNVDNPAQVTALVQSFRDTLGWNAPVLIDQEGGRVQRLGPPHWPVYPSASVFGQLYHEAPEKGLAAARLGAQLLAADLRVLGIDVDCLPVADVPVATADAVIGDRAYGSSPSVVAALAGAAATGLLDGGVLPVLKHIPGHGRATADSHRALPVVEATRKTLEGSDFVPFRALRHLPLAMTAHIVFTAVDRAAPATTSPAMIQLIRSEIGFTGLLMSDDISMKALSGSIGERTRAAIAAGCDVALHCNGQLEEMQEVAAAAPMLAGDAERRANAALAARKQGEPLNLDKARSDFAALLGGSPRTVG